MPSKTLSDVPPLVEARKEFEIGNVSARSYYDCEWTDDKGRTRKGGTHWPPGGGWNSIIAPEKGCRYAVFSYSTPIGWIDRYGVWVCPPERHSVSTSRHQRLLWRMADDPGGSTRDKERAKRRYKKAYADYFKAKAEAAREYKNERARQRRAEERRLREEQRQREREVAEAIASIVNGPAPEPLLLGIEGEREAIESIITPDACTRDAGSRRVTTRASRT